MNSGSTPRAPESAQRVAFGVGCYHFALQQRAPFRFEVSDYASKLQGALEHIASVNNVKINFDPDEEGFDVEEPLATSFEDGGAEFPHPAIFDVSFDLFIPFRIQDDLIGANARDETKTENFRVVIDYTYYIPVAFVQLLTPGRDPKPSTAIQVVREYLRREINTKAKEIRFECLGPSPFHADFFFDFLQSLPDNPDRLLFECEQHRLRGYSELTFTASSEDFETSNDALETLFFELRDELGLFYEFRRMAVESYREWSKVEEQIRSVVDDAPQSNLVANFRRRVTVGERIYKAHTRLARFEANQIFKTRYLQHQVDDLYTETEASRFLRGFLDSSLRTWPQFPTDQLGRLISFVEERRARGFEMVVVIIASLLGGIAGALFTYFVGS